MPALNQNVNPSLAPTKLCEICCTRQPRLELLQPCSCGVHYCPGCLKDRFLLASQEASMMPPSCCDGLFPIHFAIASLSAAEALQYRAKFDEWRSPVKLYCPVPWCSTFIPDRVLSPGKETSAEAESSDLSKTASKKRALTSPSLKPSSTGSTSNWSQPEQVQCTNCRARICVKCKQLCHPQSPCEDLVEHKTREVLNKLGYKSCPSCGHGVRRMYGCNHMQCICGAHFCWGCRRPIGQCEEGDECLVDDDEDCADLGDDEELDLRPRVLQIIQDLEKHGEAHETFHQLCVSVFDSCLKDDVFFLAPLPHITRRCRVVLRVLEDIADDVTTTEEIDGMDFSYSVIQILGRLARDLPDGKGITDEGALRVLIDLGRDELANAPAPTVQAEPQRDELEDLDRRDAMERDLNFGREPTEREDHFSACKHRFQRYVVPKGLQDAQIALDGMECHRCWRKVQLKENEPTSQLVPASRIRYSLRSISQATARSAAVADTVAWSCQTCRIMYCGGCAKPAEVNL